jgi:hypothetical protein
MYFLPSGGDFTRAAETVHHDDFCVVVAALAANTRPPVPAASRLNREKNTYIAK